MALQKTIALPNGAVGDYVKIVAAPVDYLAKYVAAHFALFLDAGQSAANPNAPLEPLIAKLRLEGAKFDEYLSTAALAESAADDPFRSALYIAAKTEPLLAGGGLTAVDLADAVDV